MEEPYHKKTTWRFADMVALGAPLRAHAGMREASRRVPRRSVLVSVALSGLALFACAVLFCRHRAPAGGVTLLDKDAAEIAKLQTEKRALEQALATGRPPLMHPALLKASPDHGAATKLKTPALGAFPQSSTTQHVSKAAPVAAPAPAPAAAPASAPAPAPAAPAAAPAAKREPAVHPPVQQLQAQRAALERQIEAYKVQAQKQRDPLVGGILASFKASTGDGLLSRTTTMRAADTGLLGRVGSIQDENVLGSLAATMTKPQQDQMLTVDRDRQVLNMAQAKGDVSPKEALAQRIIALGAQFLSEKHQGQPTAVKGPTSAADEDADKIIVKAMREHARGRIARKHARAVAHSQGSAPHVLAKVSDAGAALDSGPGGAKVKTTLDPTAKMHSKAVWLAKQRVSLLRKELTEAQKAATLQKELDQAQAALATTHAQEAKLKLSSAGVQREKVGQKLVAKGQGDDEGANEKYDTATAEMRKFVGARIAADEDDDAEDEPSMERRYNKQAHGAGYVKGAIYVGSREEGPDRYGQSGAGPAKVKNKLGDNVVDVGIMGAAGTHDGDVMVPTRLSMVRHRDRPQGNDPMKMRLGGVDKDTSDGVVKGSLLQDYGGDEGLQIDDKAVPVNDISGALFKDAARTQDLAQIG